MKVIIAGTRTFNDYKLLKSNLDIFKNHIEIYHKDKLPIIIISGSARGADSLGKRYAIENNLQVKEYPADWDKYGKSAGYRRNEEMGKIADVLICFWDGRSKGTLHMLNIMKKLKKEWKIIYF